MPDGIIPANIAADIAKRYPNQKPYKIEKELGGYEIDILVMNSITIKPVSLSV